MLLSSYGQATNDSISLFSSNPIQSDTYKRLEVGDTANLDTWFSALGISGATYKIIDGRVGTVNGSTLTTTNWGKTQVTATSGNNFRVIILEVRPKGAIAMPQVARGVYHTIALKADGSVWSWGTNEFGVLGRTNGNQYVPGRVVMQDGSVLKNIIQIVAGYAHILALDTNGHVWAWGNNGNGNLGNGETAHSQYPVQTLTGEQNSLDGYLQDIVSVSIGHYGSYAIATTGEALAWGYGSHWALGINEANYAYTSPKYVVGANGTGVLQNVLDVSSSRSATLFLCANGTVFGTGYNSSHGGVGDGTANNYLYPVQVKKGECPSSGDYLERIVEIKVIGYTSGLQYNTFYTLHESGQIYTWGFGNDCATGLLTVDGEPDKSNYSTPKKITALDGRQAIHIAGIECDASSYFGALAVTSDGKTYTWGGSDNYYGQLGNGTTSTLHQTPQLTTEKAFDLITVVGCCSIGYAGVKRNGTVWSWGYNYWGQVGTGSTSVGVPEAYCVGGEGAEFLDLSTAVLSGGSSAPITYNSSSPLPSTITMEETQTLAIDAAAIKKYTSYNFSLIESEKIAVTGALSFSSQDTSIATIDANGVIIPNHNKKYGETTIIVRDSAGVTGIIRVRIKPKETVAMPMIAAGSGFTVALKTDGSVWSWGTNKYGGIGRTEGNPYFPGRVIKEDKTPVTGITQIAVGLYHILLLDTNGNVWGWGNNGNGNLGDNTQTYRTYPVQVHTGEQNASEGYLQNIVRVAAGDFSSYAITSAGEALAWGYGSDWGLGINSAPYACAVPNYVVGTGGVGVLQNVLDISASRSAAIFLRTNGTVFATGYNSSHGGLGDDTAKDYLYAVQVQKGESGSSNKWLEHIVEVAVTGYTGGGQYNTFFALHENGAVYTWGFGTHYATGLGMKQSTDQSGNPQLVEDTDNYSTPKKIPALADKNILHITTTTYGETGPEYNSALATAADGKSYTWGGTVSNKGHHGNGTVTTLHKVPTPTTEKAFHLVTISGGGIGFAGAKQDGTVWAWGYNYYGQVGTGTTSTGVGDYAVPEATEVAGKNTRSSIQVNGAAIYRGNSAAAAYGADAGAAGTQCPGELWLSAFP